METTCIDFDGLQLADEFRNGDQIVGAGTVIDIRPFLTVDGRAVANRARVGNGVHSGGTGLEIEVNNVLLDVRLSADCRSITLAFGEFGGNLNLVVNRVQLNFPDFAAVDGALLDGVLVSASGSGIDGQGTGKLRLRSGGRKPITRFAIGGQELFVDDLCLTAGDFATTAPQT